MNDIRWHNYYETWKKEPDVDLNSFCFNHAGSLSLNFIYFILRQVHAWIVEKGKNFQEYPASVFYYMLQTAPLFFLLTIHFIHTKNALISFKKWTYVNQVRSIFVCVNIQQIICVYMRIDFFIHTSALKEYNFFCMLNFQNFNEIVNAEIYVDITCEKHKNILCFFCKFGNIHVERRTKQKTKFLRTVVIFFSCIL